MVLILRLVPLDCVAVISHATPALPVTLRRLSRHGHVRIRKQPRAQIRTQATARIPTTHPKTRAAADRAAERSKIATTNCAGCRR